MFKVLRLTSSPLLCSVFSHISPVHNTSTVCEIQAFYIHGSLDPCGVVFVCSKFCYILRIFFL